MRSHLALAAVLAVLTANASCTIFATAAPCDTVSDCPANNLCVASFCVQNAPPGDAGPVVDGGEARDAGNNTLHDAGADDAGNADDDAGSAGDDAGDADAGFVDAG